MRSNEAMRILAHRHGPLAHQPQPHQPREEGAGLERRDTRLEPRAQCAAALGTTVGEQQPRVELGVPLRLAAQLALEPAHVLALEGDDLESLARVCVVLDGVDNLLQSTGTSLALVCAARGYRIHIVSSDAFSVEKRDHMKALGAAVTLVPSEGGLTTKALILKMIEYARTISREPHTYWTDQLNNQDSIAGYYSLGEEIWSQTKGEIDAFVHCVGTAASLRGVATVLKRYKPSIKIIAVEPAESSVLLGGQPGPHKIEGVGIGYTPPLWDPTLVDEILPVKTDDAKAMTREIAREEALFAGTSSGANVVAAIQVAERLGSGAKVVTLMVDSGLKYLSTDVYKRR